MICINCNYSYPFKGTSQHVNFDTTVFCSYSCSRQFKKLSGEAQRDASQRWARLRKEELDK